MVPTRLLILFTLSTKFCISKGQGRYDRPTPHNHSVSGIINHLQKHDQIHYCEIKNPCLNGGQCNVNMYGLIKCSCAKGFTGDVCQVDCNDIVESCPDGFEMLPPGSGKCYHISSDYTTKNFWQAQKYCRDRYVQTSLWEPKGQEDLDKIGSSPSADGSYWTGIFDVFDEGSLIYIGTGKSVSSTQIDDTNTEAVHCVYFVTGLGLRYGQCEANKQIVCEMLNPRDLPDMSVLPVPMHAMYSGGEGG